MKPIAIYGAGGLGRETLILLHQINKLKKEWEVIGFADDELPKGAMLKGLAIIGGASELNAWGSELYIIIALGNPQEKEQVLRKLNNPFIKYATLIHPSVEMAPFQNIHIGEGCIITAGNIFTTDITIGRHVLVNLKCTLGHDVRVGSFSSLMPGCHISGDVTIGEKVYIGTGAQVINGLQVQTNAIIGAGAVVISNVLADTTVVGSPARPVNKQERI